MKSIYRLIAAGTLAATFHSAALAENTTAFQQGMRHGSMTYGTSRDPDKGRMHVMKLHRNDWLSDEVAIYYGLNVGYADMEHHSGGVQGGPEVGSRWIFANPSIASLYLDGSVATIFHERPLTPGSLHFNFELQISTGAIRQIAPGTFLNTGIGWHHYSNARVRGKGRNVGYDAVMFSVGILREF